MRVLQTSQIILRAHYLKLVELLDSAVEKIDTGRKKVRFCAAKLLEYFRYWCSWVRQHEQRNWYYRKLKQIYDDLMGEHSLHVIRAAIALLEEKELLTRSNNSNGQDKVYRYQIDNKLLEELLLQENLHSSDRNLQDSLVESQTVNQINNSSNSNFSNNESEPKVEQSEPTSESFVGKQAVSEETFDIKLRSKVKSHIPRLKRKLVREDKSSEASRTRTGSPLQAASPELWEVASLQPYPYFLQWRALHYKNQGGHWANSPQSNAYAEFYKNRFKTAILWQEFLQFYNLALDNALALQVAGIEVKLPSCFSEVATVSEQVVAQKAKIVQSQPEQSMRAIATDSDFRTKIAALIRRRTLPPTAKEQPPTDSLQQYLSWLHGDEPVLVEEARKKLTRLVMERDDLLPHWDEQGSLIDLETTEG